MRRDERRALMHEEPVGRGAIIVFERKHGCEQCNRPAFDEGERRVTT